MKIEPALWQRVAPLLDEALELPACQRPSWLLSRQVDDASRELLRRLIDDRERLQKEAFLDALPPIAPAPAPLRAGQRFGAYRLLRELGRGGMSVVWLAERDDGQLRRQVALKIPHAGPGQDLLAERLRRERDILAALAHPNIGRLYDVGTTAQGAPFLVLEFVEGRTLLEHCRAERLPLGDRIALFLQVLRAVQHAHAMLVLHRDIKPSNILVDAAGQVKLLDFGVAKPLVGDEAEATALTHHHGRALTPSYAAPEQIAGGPVGIASDIYALGVVLYELVADTRPYRLSRDTPAALEEAVLHAQPLPPSECWASADAATAFRSTPRRLRQALRGDIDLIVMTAMQKQPGRRYATADAFAQDIQLHLARQPIRAQPDRAWYRARKFVARHALAVSAAAAVCVAIGAGAGVALWQARQTQLEAAKATAIKDFLVGLFEAGSVDQDDALRKRGQTVQELLEQSATALQGGLREQPRVRGELQGVVGRLLHDLAINDAAVSLRRDRVQLLAAEGAGVGERVQALRELADSQAQGGDAKAAKATLAQAQALCAPLAKLPPLPCLTSRLALGLHAQRGHDLATARAHIEPAAKALLARAPRSAEAAEALAVLGELRGTQNRPDEAFALYRQALEVREELWGRQSVRLARERRDVANNLWADRRLVLAENELHLALEAYTAALGREHVSTALVELQLGRLQAWVRGGGAEQVRHASEVLTTSRQVAADKAFEARMVVAETLLMDGRLAEAGRALDAAMSKPPPPGEIANIAETTFAWYLQSAGRYDEARRILHALRDRLLRSFEPGHPYVADIDDRLAGVDLAEGRLDAAEAAFRRVLASQDAREDAYGSIKHQAAAGLAVVDMERGRFGEAWKVVSANHAASQKLPRVEQYRTGFFSTHEQMGRVLLGMGRAHEARRHFEQAIGALESGYAHNPDLAVARSRYAVCLATLNDIAAARRQLALADAALHAEPTAAPHFRRAVEKARGRVHAMGVRDARP